MVNENEGGVSIVRWQTKNRSTKQGLKHIGQTKEFFDTIVVVKGIEFKVHKAWVAAVSPQLFAIIAAKETNTSAVITRVHLSDVDPDAFEIITNYLYTRTIPPIPSPHLLLGVYKAAVDYGQKGIKEHCEKLVKSWELNSDNVFAMLQMSSLDVLRDKCLEYLKEHAREVLKSEGVKDAKDDSLAVMFENGYCDQIPVMELFTDIVAWSCSHFLSPNTKEEAEQRNAAVRAELMLPSGRTGRSLMGWIGFQRMSVEELSRATAEYPKLITSDEFTQLVLYAFAPADNKPPLPEWIVL